MGCWNQTCALTNLPILGGEEVYVFFLQEAPFGEKYIGDHCYANNYYGLLPLHFKGFYDDYGSCDECTGGAIEFLLQAIRENLFSKNVKLSLYDLFRLDHENKLFVKGSPDKKSRLTHIQIKKSVIEGLKKEFSSYNFRKPAKRNGYSEICKSYDKLLRKEGVTNKFFIKDSENLFSNWVHGSEIFSQNVIDVDEIILKIIKGELDSAIFKEHLCLYAVLTKFMNESRRVWIKPSGCGSQNSETEAQTLMAKLTIEGARDIDNFYEKN